MSESLTRKLLIWLHGLAAAAISSAANGVAVVIAAPESFNLHEGRDRLIAVCVVFAIVGAASYLKQSPLPKPEQQ